MDVETQKPKMVGVVYKAPLKKSSSNGKAGKYQDRWFVLQGTKIRYYKTQKDKEHKGEINLTPSCQVVDTGGKGGIFNFEIRGDIQCFFYTRTEIERQNWIQAIDD